MDSIQLVDFAIESANQRIADGEFTLARAILETIQLEVARHPLQHKKVVNALDELGDATVFLQKAQSAVSVFHPLPHSY